MCVRPSWTETEGFSRLPHPGLPVESSHAIPGHHLQEPLHQIMNHHANLASTLGYSVRSVGILSRHAFSRRCLPFVSSTKDMNGMGRTSD